MTAQGDGRSMYASPLVTRYASREMLEIFAERRKIRTWRLLWTELAAAQMELGLPITPAQVDAMRAAADDIDFEAAAEEERRLRHDVMAHVKTFARACPPAGGIIHLGATSCFVTDNTDLILMREAARRVRAVLVNVIDALRRFAEAHRDLPVLAYTHFQPAQLTTVGKRACLWIQDLMLDLEDLEHFLGGLRFRGVKGTTGTQASFLSLFDGDHAKVARLDDMVAQRMGFERSFAVTGQTYPRKVDARLLSVLSGIAASAHKFAVDLRLLAHERELEEPFEKDQIGSSAMAYKRNPMRCERITALARYVMTLAPNALHTAANQWLERTLDDSAGKRIVVPESFLGVDAILILYRNVASGLVVQPAMIRSNLEEEMDAMATENILMAAVRAGGDRQKLHEKIRRHAVEAARKRKEGGGRSDLLQRIAADEDFASLVGDLQKRLDPRLYIGRAAEQVDEFVKREVAPLLDRRRDLLDNAPPEVHV